ncbi:uncharacterized protein LOC109800890 isoform X2 [Cajanus cajan]|uniref:uncharacterized protein LOC109800890 isoform X2 n=1 Tax=Cajanus cajan TaxID=3821 RepID=UPI0010FB44B7|nr:uncharacterized protein LOC109800890 isoform X2 [Cajanus cajan]
MTKMWLNVKEILLRLHKVVCDSTKSSYTFVQRHPWFSGASLVCFILYVFLSYIYNFLVYMSPFLVCAIIFIRIFWSSEQTQLRYVKRDEGNGEQKKVEPKHPKIPNTRRPELLYKYPSQNATSRRRNFSDKKWDVYGGLEEKAKDLSTVFHNEFTKRKKENKGFANFFEKGESSLDNMLYIKKNQVHKRRTLRSEPSMVDLVECGDLEIEKIEDGDEEDGEEAREDRNKVIGWTEDDQKNLMYLGISEMERNKRLESLIARRKEKKLFKGHLEKGITDRKVMAPVITKRSNPLDFSKDFEDGLEIPNSAPSLMPRSPYDIPYEPSEEKPNLTGGSFSQEISSQKDMPFCRHESFSSGHISLSQTNQDYGSKEHYSFNSGRNYSNKVAYSRFKRHTDKGTHDWIIDQLIYNEGANNPLGNGREITQIDDIKCKTKMVSMKDEKVENDHEKKSMLDQVSELDLVPNISNIENDEVLDKSRLGLRFPKPHGRLLNFPVSTTTTTTNTNINEALYDTVTSVVDKRQENMLLTHGRLCHTPTYSVASDLQVEVSEVGSLTSTIGENVETNSSTDRDSILYDGDVDRDVSSGSEELWGTSFHGGKEAQGVRSEGDNGEVSNNSKDVVSPFARQHINEENAANISLMSSKSDMPEDTSTHATNNHHDIFGYMKHSIGETEAPQSSNSSYALNQLPTETRSEKLEEWCNNLPENVTTEEQVINEANNTTVIEQDNIENSRSSEDLITLVTRQESIDDTSTYSVSSSPRSVLPEKTMVDEVSLSAFDQQILVGAQSIMEGMAQETLDNEISFDIMPQTIQSLMDDNTHGSHNVDFNNSQEQTILLENSVEESNIFDSMNDGQVNNKEEYDEYIIESMTQETLDKESPSNTMTLTIQPLMDDTTHESHNVDYNHSQTNPQQNSIEESNIFGSMNDEEVNNKEEHDEYIMEGMTQNTLNGSSSNTMPQTIQPLMNETTHESHNVDFNHSQEHNIPLENFVEESNTFDSTNDEELNNKEDDDKNIMEGITLETLDNGSSFDTIPQIVQPLKDNTTQESNYLDFNHSQETTIPIENSIEESNIFGTKNDEEVNNKEEHDKSKDEENNEDNSNNLKRQETTTKSTKPINEITTLDDMGAINRVNRR